MKKPPIGTPPKKASERRLAEEQAKRVPRQTVDDDRIEAAIARETIGRLVQERDDAEARGEAMFEKLQPALTILRTVLLDIRKEIDRHGMAGEEFLPRIDEALSPKRERDGMDGMA